MLQYRSWSRQSGQQSEAQQQGELARAKIAAINLDIRRMEAEFALAMMTNASASILQLNSGVKNENILSPGPAFMGAAASEVISSAASDSAAASPPFALDRTSWHWLSCHVTFLTAKILWSRILRPNVRTDEAAAGAVALNTAYSLAAAAIAQD